MSNIGTEIAKPLRFLNPGPLDENRGPYLTTAAANLAIPNIVKNGRNLREGKFVEIGVDPNFVTHWWKGGYGDENIIEYQPPTKNTKSPNLFNKEDYLPNTAINSVGVLSVSAGFKTSKVLAIKAGDKITISGVQGATTGANIKRIVFYNNNGSLIDPIQNLSNSTYTAPGGSSGYQFTFKRSEDPQASEDTIMIVVGEVSPAFQPYKGYILSIGGEEINNASKEVLEQKQIGKITTRNLFNSTEFLPNTAINSSGNFNTTSGYKTSKPISLTENFYVFSGVSGGTKRYIFLDSSGAFTGFVSSLANGILNKPSGVRYIQFCFKTNTDEDLPIQLEAGSVATEYVPFNGYVNSVMGSYLRHADKELYTKKEVDTLIASSINKSDYKSKVTLIRSGNDVYIRTNFDLEKDLVQKNNLSDSAGNKTFDIINATLVPNGTSNTVEAIEGITRLVTMADDTAPINTYAEGHLMEGHGFSCPKVTTAHNKTSADLFQKFTDGTNNFYLVKIVDSNNLIFYSEPFLDNKGLLKVVNPIGSNLLTYVSGGSNTSNVDCSVKTMDQQYPVTSNIVTKVFVDDKEILTNGIYSGSQVKFLSEYDVADYSALSLSLPFAFDKAPSFLRISAAYTYDHHGACTMLTTAEFKRPKYINYWYVLQMGKFSTPVGSPYPRTYAYLPKVKPVLGLDFKNVVETTNFASSTINFTSSNVEDPSSPPDRHVQFYADAAGQRKLGLAIGYNTELGIAKKSIRKDLGQYWQIATTGKSYPRAIFEYQGMDQVFTVISYRSWFPVDSINQASCVYGYTLGNIYYLFIDFHQTVSKKLIQIHPGLSGKKMEIYERTDSFTLHTIEIAPANGLLVSVNVYGYAIIKFS